MVNSLMAEVFGQQISLLIASCAYHALLKAELRCSASPLYCCQPSHTKGGSYGGVIVKVSAIVSKLV